MLGTDLVKELQRRNIPHHAFNRSACDVTSIESCRQSIAKHQPAVVINCAAYTDVNCAESEEDRAMAINATGAGNLAQACAETGAKCIYVSTDYVFDGTCTEPYATTDQTNPINAYGRSKLAGEYAVAAALPAEACVIARTSWLFGAGGPNFVKTMLRLAREGKDLRIINDQVGSPTYTADLARGLVDLALAQAYGVFHVTGSGSCSWYDFAREIFRQSGVKPLSLEPCATTDFRTPARRPANSRLSANRLLGHNIEPLPHWTDALRRYLQETGEMPT